MEDERNNEQSKNLKCCFYYVIESLLMNLRKEYYNENMNNNPYNLYKKIQYIIQNIIKIEKKLFLFSKELFSLELINKIIINYDKQNKKNINIEEINKLIIIIIKEPELIENQNYKDLLTNLEEMNDLLKKLYGDTLEYGELINDIILNKFQIINNREFREKIINILLKDKKKNKLYSFIECIIGNLKNFETKKIMDGEINKKYINLEEKYKLNFVENNQDLFLLYFENIIEKYFIDIKHKDLEDKIKYDNLLGKASLNYLNVAINNINQNKENNKMNILRKLYLIAYIKRYLSNYVDLLFSKNIQNLSERNDINIKLFSKTIDIVKEIKLFTLKLILKKYKNNLGKIICLNNNISNYIDFEQYFNNMSKYKESIILYYFSYPVINDDKKDNSIYNLFGLKDNRKVDKENIKTFEYNDYKSFLKNIKNEKEINDEQVTELFNLINQKNNKYDILYTYLAYIRYISLINIKEEQCINNMNKIFKYFMSKELFGFKITFDYFFKSNKEQKFKQILSKIGYKEENNITKLFGILEILLYAFRFYFNILTTNNKNNFYYSLSIKFNETINLNFIPGKLINNQIKITYEKVKDILIKDPKSIEYLCSCGKSYSLSNHNEPIICTQCQQSKIKKYSLFDKGYYGRIFLNKKERDSFYSNHQKQEENILLNELEKKIEEQIKLEKGIKKESKLLFLQKKSDDISYITFRILNFILYGILFYSNIEGNISDKELEFYLVDGMTCYEIIEKDWEILDKELKMKDIPNVHIFMDIIFHKIIGKLNNQKFFYSDKVLKNFEKSIETIIENSLNDKNLIEIYLNNRNNLCDIEPNEEFAIIMDEFKYNNYFDSLRYKYNELNYFAFSKLPSIEDFKSEFYYFEKNKEKYPIINYILDYNNSTIKYLQFLPKINELCNYMINYCSYKFTREEAKKKYIYEELNNKIDLIKEFMEIYDKLRQYATKYEGHSFNDDFKSLNNDKNQNLANFCVDIGEVNYGMVLAAIYKLLIYWQNSFINQVLYYNNRREEYKELFENEIMIQDSHKEDIISLPSPGDLFEKYVIKNTYQKKYDLFDYNFEIIEEELAENILPNIKKFVSDNNKCLKYVVYQYEGFRGNKENIITIFNAKYKRKYLSKEEGESILAFIENQEKKQTKKRIDFWISLQILIDIVLENNYNGEMEISNIINENNKYHNLDNLKEFFDQNDKINFKVNSLMSIYYFLEFICWDKIKENLPDCYLIDINQNIKNKIDQFFDGKNAKIINRQNLATALRRFVSRYLSGKRGENEIKESNNFKYYLCKEELWEQKNILDNPEFDNELSLIFDKDKSPNMISVGQATKVYENLGEEIQLYINEEKGGKLNPFIGIVLDTGKSLLSKIQNFWNRKDKPKDNKENENEDLNDINRSGSNKSGDSFGSSDSNNDEDLQRISSLGGGKESYSKDSSNDDDNELGY